MGGVRSGWQHYTRNPIHLYGKCACGRQRSLVACEPAHGSEARAAEQATHHTTPLPSATTGLALAQGPYPPTRLLASVACGSLSSERGVLVTAPLSFRTPAAAPHFYGHFNLGTDRGRDLHIGSLPGLCVSTGYRGAAAPRAPPSFRSRCGVQGFLLVWRLACSSSSSYYC